MVKPSRGLRRKMQPTQPQPKRRWWWVALAIGLLVVVVVVLVSWGQSEAIEGVTTFSGLSRGHESGSLTYPHTPPVGGVHHPVWQNCGVYDEPIPNERAVHSLEHGAVWITYQPDLPPDSVETLRSLVRGQRYALLSPYEGLPAPVVATAWGVQLAVESVSDPRLRTFLRHYQQGRQTPEPGAPCTGGVGEPLGDAE